MDLLCKTNQTADLFLKPTQRCHFRIPQTPQLPEGRGCIRVQNGVEVGKDVELTCPVTVLIFSLSNYDPVSLREQQPFIGGRGVQALPWGPRSKVVFSLALTPAR